MPGPCRVCGGPAGATYLMSERMFGLGGAFPYFECTRCGCLQIAEIPADLGRYYPTDRYYSFGLSPRRMSWRRRWVARGGYERRGWLFDRFLRGGSLGDVRTLRARGFSRQERILDVGAGRGQRVLEMRQLGFAHVEGIDPFLDQDSVFEGQVLVHRRALADAPGGWDRVMLNHSFEHMPDPHAALEQLRRILAPGGKLLLRIPTVSSEAWELYREHWVGVDAPRHLYLHSRESLRLLGELHGFRLVSLEDDELAGYHYWASELFRRGDVLVSSERQGFVSPREVFSEREVEEFERRARRANVQGRGAEIAATFVVAGAVPSAARAG